MKNFLNWLSRPFPRPDRPTPPVSSEDIPPEFIPQNALEVALIEAATNPARRAAFNELLLDSDLFAATPDAPAVRQSRTIESGENLRLCTAELPGGGQATALFTAEARVAQVFGAGAGFVGIKGQTLLELVRQSDVILNPGLGYGVRWTPADLAALLGKPQIRVVARETKIMLGTPAEIPTGLTAKLAEALNADGRVTEAWLALAHWPDTLESAWYLDIRSASSRDELADMIAAMLRGTDLGGKPMDITILSPDHPPGVGIRLKPYQTH